GLQAAYANLHTDQERDYFMQRYHDVISSFGGKTSYDADNRPLLVMRSNLWASGYDVDGTDQTSLGQIGRASCRERVEISLEAESLGEKHRTSVWIQHVIQQQKIETNQEPQ